MAVLHACMHHIPVDTSHIIWNEREVSIKLSSLNYTLQHTSHLIEPHLSTWTTWSQHLTSLQDMISSSLTQLHLIRKQIVEFHVNEGEEMMDRIEMITRQYQQRRQQQLNSSSIAAI